MKKYITLASVCCIFMITCCAAHAQWDEDKPSKLGLSLGFYMPSDSEVADAIGNMWFGPVLSYNARFDSQDRPVTIVSLGIFGKDGEDGFKGTLTPLTVSMVKRHGEGQRNWYAGGGTGIYFGKITLNGQSLGSVSNTNVGFHLLGGRDFGKGFYTELRYDYVPKNGDPNGFSGMTLGLGLRQTF